MNKEIIHHAIEHPELITPSVLNELESISGQYPYFGAAQILLSKAYHSLNDHRFTDQLHQAAIYAGDRGKLYSLIKESAVEEQTTPEITEQTDTATESAEQLKPVSAQTITNEEVSLASGLAAMIMSDESVVVISMPAETKSAEPLQENNLTTDHEPAQKIEAEVAEERAEVLVTEPEEDRHPEIPVMDAMQQEILLEAMQSSIEMEVQPVHEEQDEIQADENSFAALIYRRSRRLHFGEPENAAGTSSDSDSDREGHDTGQTAEEEDLPAFRSTPMSHGTQKIRIPDARSHQRDLIDRFIHLEPNISRGKLGEYPAGNIAKDSLEDDFSFITETMAQLFARQGKLDKARKAYKKLIELHPEKSIYFAAQLKNLDQLKK